MSQFDVDAALKEANAPPPEPSMLDRAKSAVGLGDVQPAQQQPVQQQQYRPSDTDLEAALKAANAPPTEPSWSDKAASAINSGVDYVKQAFSGTPTPTAQPNPAGPVKNPGLMAGNAPITRDDQLLYDITKAHNPGASDHDIAQIMTQRANQRASAIQPPPVQQQPPSIQQQPATPSVGSVDLTKPINIPGIMSAPGLPATSPMVPQTPANTLARATANAQPSMTADTTPANESFGQKLHRTIYEIGKAEAGGLFVDLPQAIGKTERWFGGQNGVATQGFQQQQEAEAAQPYAPNLEGLPEVSKQLVGAARFLPQLGAYGALGVPGAAAMLLTMGGSTAQDTADRAKAMGMDDKTALRAGWLTGAATGAGYAALGAVAGKAAQGAAAPFFKSIGMEVGPATPFAFSKNWAGNTAAAMATQTMANSATMAGMNVTNAAIENHYGFPHQDLGEAAKQGGMAGLAFTALLAPNTISGQLAAADSRAALVAKMNNVDTPPVLRVQAAAALHGLFDAQYGKDAANQWFSGMVDQINRETKVGKDGRPAANDPTTAESKHVADLIQAAVQPAERTEPTMSGQEPAFTEPAGRIEPTFGETAPATATAAPQEPSVAPAPAAEGVPPLNETSVFWRENQPPVPAAPIVDELGVPTVDHLWAQVTGKAPIDPLPEPISRETSAPVAPADNEVPAEQAPAPTPVSLSGPQGNEVPAPEAPAEQAAPAPAKPQKRSENLLTRIRQLGGISMEYARDVTGENSSWSGLFRDRTVRHGIVETGHGLDDLVPSLAKDFGIDTNASDGGQQQLADMINKAVGGKQVYSFEDQQRQMQADEDAKIIDAARQAGIKTRGRDVTDILEDLNASVRKQMMPKEQSAYDKAEGVIAGLDWPGVTLAPEDVDAHFGLPKEVTSDEQALAQPEERLVANANDKAQARDRSAATGRAGEGQAGNGDTLENQPDQGRQKGYVAPTVERRLTREDRRLRYKGMSPEELIAELEAHDRRHYTSHLTGLPNKAAYDEAPKLPVQAFADIDGLKTINDTLGHEAGDVFIKAMADALKAETDQVFHRSGDEFYVQGKTEEEVRGIMDRALKTLNKHEFEYTAPDGEVFTKKGVGFSYGTGHDIKTAEEAQYADKAARKALGLRADREPGGVGEAPAARGKNEGRAQEGQEGFALAPQTTEELKAQAEKRDAAEKAKADEEAKAKADEQRGSFALTGSDRQADMAGQGDLVAELKRAKSQKVAGTFDPNNPSIIEQPKPAYDKQHEDPYQNIETRTGTKPEQLDAGRKALAAAEARIFGTNRAGLREAPTIRGSSLSQDYRRDGGTTLVGKTVTEARDVATLAQVLRDPRFETFRVFYTDDSGKVVGEGVYSSRLPGAVYMPHDLADHINDGKERFKATGYWMVHNHPSGVAEASTADLRLTEKVAYSATGFKGHVIIDHDEFNNVGVQDGRATTNLVKAPELGSVNLRANPEVPHPLLGIKILKPNVLAAAAKQLQVKDGYVTIIGTDAQGKVSFLTEAPVPDFHAIRNNRMTQLRILANVKRAVRETGSLRLFAVVPGHPFDYGAMVDSGIFSDVIRADTGESAATLGLIKEAGLPVTKVEQRGGKYGVQQEAEPYDFRKEPHFGEDETKRGIDAGYSLYSDIKPLNRGPSKSIGDSIARIFTPAAREAAVQTAGIIRNLSAEKVRQLILAEEELKSFAKQFSKMPVQASYDFIDKMERGIPITGELGPAAQALRKVLDSRRDAVIALGKGQLENFNENYFPHIWHDKTTFANFIRRRPLEGGKGFLKQRTYDYLSQGLAWKVKSPDGSMQFFKTKAEAKAAAGPNDRISEPLTPITTNPVEMALLKAREMDRYIYGQRIFQEMKDAGIAKFVRFGAKQPDGWAKIDDKIARVMQYSETEKGMILRGEYYAPEAAATILNNHLSPGLGGIPVYDLVRKSGNLLNGIQLGLSGYHLGFTTFDAVVSKAALGLKQISYGDIAKGLSNITIAGSSAAMGPVGFPLLALHNLYRGDKLLKAYLGKEPELSSIVDALIAGGGRIKMDAIYRNQGINEFRQALRTGNYRSAALKALPRLLDVVNKPIFEYLVPRQKLGVFFDMAKDALDKEPDMTIERKREVMGKFWDSVDNRMGEMVYDNVFWNRALKDSLMVATRSVGWNLGTFRELGGGVKDIAKIKQLGGISDRTAYIFGLTFVSAIAGALTQYLYTGKGPEELKDLIFPRTGKIRPDGTEDRISLPTYMKDIGAYASDIRGFVKYGENPFQTLENKTHPLISMLGQMLTNKDFFGGAIRSPGDTPSQQLLDEADFILKQATPFGVRNYQQQAKLRGEEPTIGGYLTSPQMIGITPSPGYITKTPEQVESTQVSRMHDALMMKFKREIRDGADPAEVIQRARAAGITSPHDLANIRSSVVQRPPRRIKSFGTPGLSDAAQ